MALTMKPLNDEPESVTVTDSPALAEAGALNEVVALPFPLPCRLGTEQPDAPVGYASKASGKFCSSTSSISTSRRSAISAPVGISHAFKCTFHRLLTGACLILSCIRVHAARWVSPARVRMRA